MSQLVKPFGHVFLPWATEYTVDMYVKPKVYHIEICTCVYVYVYIYVYVYFFVYLLICLFIDFVYLFIDYMWSFNGL